jgi:hypothetical protein
MWKVEWEALSARIAGIIESGTFLFQTRENDAAYSTNVLIENCHAAAEAVLDLRRHGTALPPRATVAIDRFDEWWRRTWLDAWLSGSGGFPALQSCVVLLGSIRAELGHLLADHDAIIRSHVTRSFQHLQRLLIADEEARAKWQHAFQDGETSCEQLGGVHLLLHGI